MKITTVTLVMIFSGFTSCGDRSSVNYGQEFSSLEDCEVVLEQLVKLEGTKFAKCEVTYEY